MTNDISQINKKSDISSEDILNIYVSSTGIISLVIDRLNSKYFPQYDAIKNKDEEHFDEVDLLQALSQPYILAKFESVTKAQIYMRTFSAANQALSSLEASISRLEPYEISKTVTNLIDKIDSLSKHKDDQDGMNVNNYVFNNLIPQEAQLAIQYLQNKHTQPIPTPKIINAGQEPSIINAGQEGRGQDLGNEIIPYEEIFTPDP